MEKYHDYENASSTYIHKIYQNIIFLALVIHTIFTFASFLFQLPGLIVYNSFSILFYAAMIQVSRKNHFRTAVSSIHAEVCLFVCVTTLALGWDKGFALYLIALSTLVYFCPFKNKYVPYLFSILEFIIFISLKLYLDAAGQPSAKLPGHAGTCLYLFNSLASFLIILYASYLSNLSASVNLKKLVDANEDLSEIANHDALTGLYNRHYVLEQLKSYEKKNILTAIGDIDNFKSINDLYGHSCGDYVLCTIAMLIKTMSGNKADVCRWGGEEFLLIFCDCTIKEAYGFCQDVCRTVAAYPFIYKNLRIRLTMTIGLCQKPEIDFANQLLYADECLYKGKARGKNQVVLCDFEDAPAKPLSR